MKLGSVVLDSDNAEELAAFYEKLLSWTKIYQEHEGEKWIILVDESGKGVPLVFQQIADYQRPVWPTKAKEQQQMLHLDFYVPTEEFEREVKRALACGARLASEQLSPDWRVFLDPAGHPFCIIPVPADFYENTVK